MPDGMVKNQKIGWSEALLTPSTKSDEHDEPISGEEVVAGGLMSQADWDTCAGYATALFAFGSKVRRVRSAAVGHRGGGRFLKGGACSVIAGHIVALGKWIDHSYGEKTTAMTERGAGAHQ